MKITPLPYLCLFSTAAVVLAAGLQSVQWAVTPATCIHFYLQNTLHVRAE